MSAHIPPESKRAIFCRQRSSSFPSPWNYEYLLVETADLSYKLVPKTATRIRKDKENSTNIDSSDKEDEAVGVRHNRERETYQRLLLENPENCYASASEFALETSLHGLKYIFQPGRHFLERIFWLIAFSTGVVLATWLISDLWLVYYRTPTVVTFEPSETPMERIPFPAITICNMNRVRKSKVLQFSNALNQQDDDPESLAEAREILHYLDKLCTTSASFSQKFNLTNRKLEGRFRHDGGYDTREDEQDTRKDMAKFLQIAAQPCSDMLVFCSWQGTVYNCSDLFKPIETGFGKCCTFNMMPHLLLYKNQNPRRVNRLERDAWSKWNIKQDNLLYEPTNANGKDSNRFDFSNSRPRRQVRSGKSSGLSILLNPDLDEYYCTSSDSYGFLLAKHLPIDVPSVSEYGIAIRPSSEVFIGLRPRVTVSHENIRNLDVKERNCYFYGEFKLAYFKYYTASNCIDECLANETYRVCGCVNFYMSLGDDSRELCAVTRFHCVDNMKKNALKYGVTSMCSFCLPGCNDISYTSETTYMPMQPGFEDSGLNGEGSRFRSKKNLTILHVYFNTGSTYAKLRKQLYEMTDLIANTGGLLGLCMGFSGLSLVELLYFFSLRLWCRARRYARPQHIN